MGKNYKQNLQFQIIEGNPVIVICILLTKRIHSTWKYYKELMFIDSTGYFDRNQHCVFIMITHSFAEGLLLGILITSTERAVILKTGLKLAYLDSLLEKLSC